MNNSDICKLLRSNPYPGRGIIIGRSGCGKHSVLLYFIMGRSVNSRNRVFEKTEDGIRTKAYDLSLLTDPSLVIYRPVRVLDGRAIVTNGAQTDTIHEYLQSGRDFSDALDVWEFEPDPPIFTPRISGLLEPDGSYRLSILKTQGGDPLCCCRYLFEYPVAIPGTGRFLSTYKTDGDPPPSFEGEPAAVGINLEGGLDAFAGRVWDALNEDHKVSLYARVTELATGESNEIIINANQ